MATTEGSGSIHNVASAWQILGRTAGAFGQAEAFVAIAPDGRSARLTYAEVCAEAEALSTYFIEDLGLAPGDVIAIQLPNCLQYPVAVFGAWRAGLIVTCANPLYTLAELRHQLSDSGAKVLVCQRSTAEALQQDGGLNVGIALTIDMGDTSKQVQQGDNTLIRSMASVIAAAAGRAAPEPRHWRIALYQYTGGTTGRSKGAILTHANLSALVAMTEVQSRQYGHISPGMTVLTPIPLYHVFALSLSLLVFTAHGGRNVLVASPRPLSNLRPAFEAYRFDWLFGVQTLYAALLAEPWFEALAPQISVSVTGGSALQIATGEAWRERVGAIVEGYGLTESAGVVSVNPPNASARLGTVGLPFPGVDIEIRRDDGGLCGPGEAGELFVRGPNIFEGYLNAPDETAVALPGGWLRTGDVVIQDTDGFLRIIDRKKDLIIVSGFNVYPAEVEDALSSHPAVLEVGVVGKPDAKTGEAVVAFVKLKPPGATPAELVDHTRKVLTAYKVPQQVVIREELPKSPVGKILRFELSKSVSGLTGTDPEA